MPTTTRSAGVPSRLLAATAVAGLILAGAVVTAGTAEAASGGTQDWGAASQFVAQINGARAANGRSRLVVTSALSSAAASWAASMARSNTLAHNPNLAGSVRGWKERGENVGVGYSVSSLKSAFWASSGHRANMLDSDYTQIGVAVVNVGGKLWVAEEFMRPMGATSVRHARHHKASNAVSHTASHAVSRTAAHRASARPPVTNTPTAQELARSRQLERAFDARHDPGPSLSVAMLHTRSDVAI